MPDSEEIISDFMGDDPRAAELREMREALKVRLRAARAERLMEEDAQRRAQLAAQIATLERQIAALRTEEAISQFVEDSVRVTLSKPSGKTEKDEEE